MAAAGDADWLVIMFGFCLFQLAVIAMNTAVDQHNYHMTLPIRTQYRYSQPSYSPEKNVVCRKRF